MPATVRPELAANPAAFGTGLGQEISRALLDFFLPERKNFLLGQLNSARCACVNRFGFLNPLQRRRALEIDGRIQQQFATRIEALQRRIVERHLTAASDRQGSTLLEEREQLFAERDKALSTELQRNNITLPEAEMSDLKAQPMRLRAATTARGDALRAWALRVAEVNQILRQEPPRRTVTGSFRPH